MKPDATEAIATISQTAIDDLLELGGAELLVELIDLFFADTPPKIESLATAVGARDAGVVAEVAHALKSSSASVGALRMSALCRDFEHEARAGTVAPRESVAALRAEWDQVAARLAALRDEGR